MFLLEYIKDPRGVGAISPSSGKLAKNMIKNIEFRECKCIVEYGPGTGVFTEKLLARINEETLVILIEINELFFYNLVKLYGHKKNVIILKESAENIDKILMEYKVDWVDYIISGIPFTSLPKDVSERILDKTKLAIGDKGKFITFQYSLLKMKIFDRVFKSIKVEKTLINLPPAYVLTCSG